ncbi:aldolase/citrate lyase family protein [Alsobacter sp. R-9]
MNLPQNAFKRALAEGRSQIGFWCTLPGGYVAECLAGAGYDWLLLDNEHSPGDPLTILPQLQACAPYPVTPVVRPASNDAVLIKRILDLGAQSLLIPYVQTVDEARAAVAATRYPPLGIRGVGGTTRATGFGRIPDYGRRAAEELCVLVQLETLEALEQLEAIAAVEGVDGIFIGPGDLAASMGFVGQPGRDEVKAVIEKAIARIRACGKPAGILTPDKAFAARCIELGTTFTAVGIDAALLARGAEALAKEFKSPRS